MQVKLVSFYITENCEMKMFFIVLHTVLVSPKQKETSVCAAAEETFSGIGFSNWD